MVHIECSFFLIAKGSVLLEICAVQEGKSSKDFSVPVRLTVTCSSQALFPCAHSSAVKGTSLHSLLSEQVQEGYQLAAGMSAKDDINCGLVYGHLG